MGGMFKQMIGMELGGAIANILGLTPERAAADASAGNNAIRKQEGLREVDAQGAEIPLTAAEKEKQKAMTAGRTATILDDRLGG